MMRDALKEAGYAGRPRLRFEPGRYAGYFEAHTRPIVDALRGALPYHKAIRGTIMSLGSFAKGAQEGALFAGAAPITLIDGKRLLDLCIKHRVGVRHSTVDMYEINDAFFAELFGDDDEDEADEPQPSAEKMPE
jgi:hypothetical protein